MHKTVIYILLVFSFSTTAQSFDVDQIEQLFRPRIRFDSRFFFNSQFKDTIGNMRQGEAGAVFTFPIRSRLGAEVNADLFDLKTKDFLNKAIRVNASQLLGMIRVNTRQVHFGFDSVPAKNLVNATAGIMGAHLTRKYRVLFYSAGVSMSEQDKTFNYFVPRVSGLIGQMHLLNLRKNFPYSRYSNQQFPPGSHSYPD